MTETLEKSEFPLSSIEFAENLDNQDKLSKFRQEFVIPLRRYVSGENAVTG